MNAYLTGIKNHFGYITAFVVSEKSRRYYTPNGIDKIVNPEKDPYDCWYQFFIDSKQPYKLDTDRNEMYDYQWNVFVNARITDDDGTLLGVCGIGVVMEDLQNIIAFSEKKYGVKINMIDPNGLVQVDTNPQNIESAYISDAIKDNASDKEFTYIKKSSGGFRMTRYMKALDWYLVIQTFSDNDEKADITFLILLYALLLSLLVLVMSLKEKAALQTEVRVSQPIDPLTALPNRNYLNEFYGEQGIFNTTRYKSLAMFDIDRFKTTNETRDGNKILLDIVELTKNCIDERGIIFRWAGDEFVFFLEMDITEAEKIFVDLCAKIKEKLDVTISAGIVKVDLTESIKTNYHRAVQLCYKVKANGGNGVSVEK